MKNENNDLLSSVAKYYAEKLAEHGETARGVDWNGEESQYLRFNQLCKIIDTTKEYFSLNDLGCGYGALLDYLHKEFPSYSYLGIDVSPEMIEAARTKAATMANTRFISASSPDRVADYGVASGIFNVRLNKPNAEWLEYVEKTLDVLANTSKHGFAFNCLTSYSDEHKKRDYLYYADPCYFFDLCKRRYSRNIALLHDYDLYEFTILVKKSS